MGCLIRKYTPYPKRAPGLSSGSAYLVYNLTMVGFDASLYWIVLAPRGTAGARTESAAIADLRRCLGILAARAGTPGSPDLRDGAETAPDEANPIIVLNCDGKERGDDYAWRAGSARVEIFGGSESGLARGIYDFLDALGFGWPVPGAEKLPEPASGPSTYEYSRSSAHFPPKNVPSGRRGYRRLLLDTAVAGKEGEAWVQWAVRNRLDAVVIPFDIDESALDAWSDRVLHRRQRIVAVARRLGIPIERGGRCLSRLVPRRLFLRNRELFRMREGKRTADRNFCPTNPETIAVLAEQAKKRFRDRQDAETFHLWPDEAADGGWCSCPSCRAFSPAEQALIAINAVADALSEIRSAARLSFIVDDSVSGAIKPRPNLIPIDEPSRDPEADAAPSVDEWIFADKT